MQPNPRVHMKQQGIENRSAARDYVEYQAPFSVDQFMLCEPEAILHQHAIKSEKFFKKYFGLELPMEQRRDFVEVKERFDFTNTEMKTLIKAKYLTLSKGRPVVMKADLVWFFYYIATIMGCILMIELWNEKMAASAPSQSPLLIMVIALAASVWWFYQRSLLPMITLTKRRIMPWQSWRKA